MINVDVDKLYEYLRKTNQTNLNFIDKFRDSNWTIPEMITYEYRQMYLKDNDFILPNNKIEMFAQAMYLYTVIYFDYLFPLVYSEYYKWFYACHSVAGTYDVNLKFTPIQ